MTKAPTPGRELLLQVRAGFIAKGTNYHAWCREHDVLPSSARQALIGTWDGPKGRALRARIAAAAGVTESGETQ
jgi:hypothetical protein